MVFNSYIFIMAFLPLVLIGYFLINKYCCSNLGRAGLVWLLLLSFVFYAYSAPRFVLLFIVSILVNYVVTKFLKKLKQGDKGTSQIQKMVLIGGIILDLLPLIFFKYSNFMLDSIGLSVDEEWILEVGVPLGISFYTFLQIAYIVDCYRSEEGFGYTFLEYATYVVFFPKITMGPIVLHDEIIPQLREADRKKLDYNNISQGFYAFTLGLAKKVLIADVLAKFVSAGFQNVDGINSATAIFVMLSYTLQLYFDFSGYCDMAGGVAKMLNIDLPYNFNSPYKARSISEFWQRWHMTLTRFFTRYVYIPLGGSRKGKFRTYVNNIIVFLLSGIWHGANWTFIFWGLLHGILMVMEKIGKDIGLGFKAFKGFGAKAVNVVKWVVTFIIINVTWIFFRAESIEQAFLYLKRIFSGGWKCQDNILEIFDKLIEVRLLERIGFAAVLDNYAHIAIWVILVLMIASTVLLKNTQEKMKNPKYSWARSVVTSILMVWCIISLSDVSEFLYFNF